MSGTRTTSSKVTLNLLKLFNKLEESDGWETRHWQTYDKSRQGARGRSCSVGKYHRDGNRYCDVFPYNDTRVLLHGLEDDYINASYVTLPVTQRSVICAQGPMEHTRGLFWQMVWQEDSRVVVMLAECDTHRRTPAHLKLGPYWPTGEIPISITACKHFNGDVIETAEYRVELVSRQESQCYVFSELNLIQKKTGTNRHIFHFQYLGWPDFGAPTSPEGFLQLLYKAREYYPQSPGPVVVHCLAGIGRTGTYVLVDSVLGIIEEKRTINIDIESVLLRIREQRVAAVQMPEQFRFAMLAVVQSVQTRFSGLDLESGEEVVLSTSNI